ncbi:MAG: hypothetical protein HN736_07810 [Anaerolineae bacterium]|jgi:hypothetical protein|nr:hypothetical protein [Anaerolineae bacterium]MBT3714555.1 hypothetical protein [Anaerolineae bacterium]MBT4311759.1 hypothetical protein [Anaerolineae bacterium]MBT4457315.1 hypothetical protein [Anaerolineae bacterium]MBT4843430.1 hypothetical protein [Anaerolineae bacterium]
MKACFNCNSTEEQIPLIELNYQGKKLFICPRCLPQLIHKPTNLVGTLPGAENIRAADDV